MCDGHPVADKYWKTWGRHADMVREWAREQTPEVRAIMVRLLIPVDLVLFLKSKMPPRLAKSVLKKFLNKVFHEVRSVYFLDEIQVWAPYQERRGAQHRGTQKRRPAPFDLDRDTKQLRQQSITDFFL